MISRLGHDRDFSPNQLLPWADPYVVHLFRIHGELAERALGTQRDTIDRPSDPAAVVWSELAPPLPDAESEPYFDHDPFHFREDDDA